jgi:hypothetical protein
MCVFAKKNAYIMRKTNSLFRISIMKALASSQTPTAFKKVDIEVRKFNLKV